MSKITFSATCFSVRFYINTPVTFAFVTLYVMSPIGQLIVLCDCYIVLLIDENTSVSLVVQVNMLEKLMQKYKVQL